MLLKLDVDDTIHFLFLKACQLCMLLKLDVDDTIFNVKFVLWLCELWNFERFT